MSNWARLSLVAGFILGISSFAGAEILTVNSSVTFDGIGSRILTVGQFNQALGTLTGVTVNISHEAFNYFRIDNDDPVNAVSARANMVREWTITGAGVDTGAAYTWRSGYYPLARDNGDGLTYDYGGPDGYDWGQIGYGSTSFRIDNPVFVLDAADWSSYTGNGNVAFNIETTAYDNYIGYQATNPTQQQQSIEVGNPGLGVGVSVTYEYTPGVPEPGSLALLPMALGGLMLWRRRRSA